MGRKMILMDDRVKLISGRVGTVVFKGTVNFAKGIWYGIELDTPDGRHDGTVKQRRYFQTKKKTWCFCSKTKYCRSFNWGRCKEKSSAERQSERNYFQKGKEFNFRCQEKFTQ